MGRLCTEAGQKKLEVLVTYPFGKPTFEHIDGTNWRVKTSLNHQTKWNKNIHDVTCVVGWTSPEVTVRSVETVRR